MRTTSPRAFGGSTSQAAARILVLLDRLGVVPTSAELAEVPTSVTVMHASMRLLKLDFWMRNPDYLADELLIDIEAGHVPAAAGLAHVARMLSGPAPTIHMYPMQRYRYGAWELPDNALALLKSHKLATHRRAGVFSSPNASRARRDYFLLAAGRDVVTRLRQDVDQIAWYDKQAEAIEMLSVGPTGMDARNRQYAHAEYEDTPIGEPIASILDRVRPRYENACVTHGFTPPDQSIVA